MKTLLLLSIMLNQKLDIKTHYINSRVYQTAVIKKPAIREKHIIKKSKRGHSWAVVSKPAIRKRR